MTSREVGERLERLDVRFGATGHDRFGVSKKALRTGFTALSFLYHRYFRTRCFGVANIPTSGRVMLVGNHSGGYAIDAVLLVGACFFELEPPRLAHGMAEKFIGRIPFLSSLASEAGQLTGLPEHARLLLEDERVLMVFPEGVRGTAKLYKDRRTLVRFGNGFMRLALETGTPIVPTAILGGGEALPTIANLNILGKMIGVPYIPITPYGLPLPLPAQLDYHFGEPMRFSGDGTEPEGTINRQANEVQQAISKLIATGSGEYRRW